MRLGLASVTHGMDLVTPLHSQGLPLIVESIDMASDVPAVIRLNGSKGVVTKADACAELVNRMISLSETLLDLEDWEGAAVSLQRAKETLAKGPAEVQPRQYFTLQILIHVAEIALGKVGSADLERG